MRKPNVSRKPIRKEARRRRPLSSTSRPAPRAPVRQSGAPSTATASRTSLQGRPHPMRPRSNGKVAQPSFVHEVAGLTPAAISWDPQGFLTRQDWGSLIPHLRKTGVDVEIGMGRLRQYAGMVLSWNRSFSNLISKNDEARIVSRHLVESIEPAAWLAESGARRWIDLGSGGGLPAIPLLLAGVGESWTLVESRRTKALFLRRVAQEMGITSLEVRHARLEGLLEEGAVGREFDGFTSRATIALGATLALAAQVVVAGGSAFLWKGSSHARELEEDAGWRGSWRHDGVVTIGAEQSIVSRFTRL